MSSDPIISELAPLPGAIASTDLLVVQRGASDLLQAPVSGLAGFVRSVIATTDDVPEGARLYFTVDRANTCADARIAAQKGQAEGIMPLDSGGKAPLAYMPDALIGQVKFKGVWDAATNSPALPSATASIGYYYVTSVAGSFGGIDYDVGDWCISDGTTWGKVDNSDAITSFAGRVGAILPIASDYSSFYLGLSATASDSSKLGGQLPAYYAQASHTHTFTSLTSKPTTLAGYGITDAATAGHTHSGYETAIGNPSVSGYLLSSSTAGVRSWVAPYSHPATHAQSVIDSSTGWITTALAGKQASGNYAASATPGGPATTADKLSASRSINGVGFNGSSDITIGTTYDGNYYRITNPGGGAYTSPHSSVTGAILIKLPVGMSSTMVKISGKVFNFSSGYAFDFVVSGYNYSAESRWVNTSAYILGTPTIDRRYTIRYGFDSSSGNAVIYIGELDGNWSYPQVYITEVLCGYSGQSVNWTKNWVLGFETSSFKNVTSTINYCQVGYVTTSSVANAGVLRDESGHIFGNYGYYSYLNMSHGQSARGSDTVFYSSNDDFLRKNTADGFRASLNVPTRTGGDASGTWNIGISGNSDGTYWVRSNAALIYGVNGLNYFNAEFSAGGTSTSYNVAPHAGWFHIIRMNHANDNGYYTDIACPFHYNGIYYRRIVDGTNNGWYQLMDSVCYPNLQAIENLAGTAGVPVKTAANTWELRNGYTGQVPLGSGTYLNFTKGILTSVVAT